MAKENKPGIIRVACVQMLPARGEPRQNIERAERLVREAADRKADVIICPETTLVGYTTPGKDGMTLEDTRRLAEPVPGPSVNHFAALARELGVYIVWGLHEICDGKYHNAAVPLSPAGEVLGTYRKVHINKYESPMGWTNGEAFHVWPCRVRDVSFNLGIMICFDREVPEAARCLAVLGADLIAVPQATGCTCQIPIHRDQLRVRAYENEVYVAMANWAGDTFKGHSMIIGAAGEVLQLGGRDEMILVADLDIAGLKRHREGGIYGRHHRRPGAYGPLLER
jgi:predicted amidohydrolase